MKKKMDDQTIRRLSAESLVDIRTIRRWLAGEPVRSSSQSRIEAAAKKLKVK